MAKAKSKPTPKKPARKPAQRRKVAAKALATASRPGSKRDAVLALLRRANGATAHEIMKATGWQRHSVRGFIVAVVKTRLGLKVEAAVEDRGRVYRVG